jgi:iron complex outermembrane receptor protein
MVAAAVPAHADDPVAQDPIVVSATRSEARIFDVPAAIGSVDASTISIAGPQVNISESLSRIPGIAVLNRQNYAQDLQLSIRGFGSRSTFGIRGVRLIVDGIPATTPDGQGQASSIALSSTARIEVLRGPVALLYGNAAGGVVQVFSKDGAPQPTASVILEAGSFGMDREDAQLAMTSGPHSFMVDASHFHTDGYRDHSSATRNLGNAKWTWQASSATRISVVVNVLDQPLGLDPLGLTHDQWLADPRQVQPIAIQLNTHKNLRQDQAGVVLEHHFDDATTLTGRVYYGERKVDNALGIPLAAQLPPTSAGGIVSFDRDYSGAELQLTRRFAFGSSAVAQVTAGFDYDKMHDDRQGYINNNGERGALKRNEDDYVHDNDTLLMGTLDVGSEWSAIGGVRWSHVAFETHDHFIVPGNPDDSGNVSYSAANPVLGVTWHADPAVNVYANAGRGFETPTFTELAYSNTGSGMNLGLKAAHSKHFEVGAKWRGERQAIDAAAYHVTTDDELIVDTNVGGRSTYRNAGPTVRQGFELSHVGRWSEEWSTQLALTALSARYDSSFTSGSGAAAVPVARGNRLPGTPDRSAFAELAYAPGYWKGFTAAAEVLYMGRLYVDDANSDFAPAATTLNLRVGWKYRNGPLEIEPLVRLDNATDRRYAGSVIVNESNRRFFEPALPRNWLVALTGRYQF